MTPWLRWLLFFPLALLIATLGNLVVGLAFMGVGLRNQIFLNGVSAFVFGFLLVLSCGILAPSKQARIAMVVCGVLASLAMLSFVLAILRVEGFVERIMPDRLSIPVLQILGALYAMFLVPCFTTPGTTLERLWREIISLGVVVMYFGGILSIVGLIMGGVTQAWATLAVGAVVLGIGIATWFFPFVHVFLRVKKIK